MHVLLENYDNDLCIIYTSDIFDDEDTQDQTYQSH